MTALLPSVGILSTSEELGLDYSRLEIIARNCYKSEELTDPNLIIKIAKAGHLSMLEFGDIIFRFVCSRSVSHQLVRHRLAVYAQESQRYCETSDWIVPIAARKDRRIFLEYQQSVERSFSDYRRLLAQGVKKEEAREVLPNCAKTEIICKANFSSLLNMLNERCFNKHAQPAIRELFGGLYSVVEHLPIFRALGTPELTAPVDWEYKWNYSAWSGVKYHKFESIPDEYENAKNYYQASTLTK